MILYNPKLGIEKYARNLKESIRFLQEETGLYIFIKSYYFLQNK